MHKFIEPDDAEIERLRTNYACNPNGANKAAIAAAYRRPAQEQAQPTDSIRDYSEFREYLERLSEPGLAKAQAKVIRREIYDIIDARVRNLGAAQPQAAIHAPADSSSAAPSEAGIAGIYRAALNAIVAEKIEEYKHPLGLCMALQELAQDAIDAALAAPAPTVAAPSENEATRLVCLEAAQKLRTYASIYTGDKQARRLVDELSNIAAALAAPTGASQSAGAIPTWRERLLAKQPVADSFDDCAQKLLSTSHMLAEIADLRAALATPPAAMPAQASPAPEAMKFIDDIIEVAFEAGELDGATIQEWAEHHGLLAARTMTEPCGAQCRCAETSDFPLTCYRKTYREPVATPPAPAPAIQAQPLMDADPMMQLLALNQHFKAQGWRDMFECPRDTEVEFMEFGSTGIHKGVRLECGDVFLAPDGEYSMPILWRAIDRLAGDTPARGGA